MSRDLISGVIVGVVVSIAIAIPVLAYRESTSLARRRHQSPVAMRIGAAAMALIPALTISPILIVLGFCFGSPPPGESDAARRLKREAAPVVAALERYRDVHAEYPRSLTLLVPDYLAPGVLPLRPVQEVYPVTYHGDSADYTLAFRYSGSGMNECRYTPSEKWMCHGWY